VKIWGVPKNLRNSPNFQGPQKPKEFSQILRFPQNPKEFTQIYEILKAQGILPNLESPPNPKEFTQILRFPKNLRNSPKF